VSKKTVTSKTGRTARWCRCDREFLRCWWGKSWRTFVNCKGSPLFSTNSKRESASRWNVKETSRSLYWRKSSVKSSRS
jgi:hypothetical protein